MDKKGQMYTIEAILALLIIIGIIAFAARSAPQETQIESSLDTQLMLYGEDFLSILDLEDENHRCWLYDQVEGNVSSTKDFATNFSNEWEKTSLKNRSVFYKLALYNATNANYVSLSHNATRYGEPPQNAVTVTRLVTLVSPPQVEVYEVRLTLWYI